MKTKESKFQTKYVLYALLFSVLFCIPCFTQSMHHGHDMYYHLARIEQIAIGFRHGDIYPYIFFDQLNGYGYGTPLFYSSFFFLLPGLFRYLGMNLLASYKLFIFIVTFVTALLMMKVVDEISNNSRIAIFASFLYVFATYRFTDVYVRAATGEFIALMVAPLIMLGTYRFLWTEKKAWPMLSAGFALCLLAHNVSFIVFCLAFGFILVINIKKWLNKTKIIDLVLAVGFGLGLSLFFLAPMLEQLRNSNYIVNTTDNAYFVESTYGLLSFLRVDTDITDVYSTAMNISPGAMLILLSFTGVLFFKKDKRYMLSLLLCLFLIVLESDIAVGFWRVFTPLWILQFPFRLNVIIVLVLSVLSAYTLEKLYVEYKPFAVAELILCSLIIFVQFVPVFMDGFMHVPNTEIDKIAKGNTEITNMSVGGGNYLPISLYGTEGDFSDYFTGDLMINGKKADYEGTYKKISFVSSMEGESEIITPKIFYTGYTLNVYLSGMNIEKVAAIDIGGMVGFNLTLDSGYEYVLEYTGTKIQKLSSIVSIVSLMAFFGINKKSTIKAQAL